MPARTRDPGPLAGHPEGKVSGKVPQTVQPDTGEATWSKPRPPPRRLHPLHFSLFSSHSSSPVSPRSCMRSPLAPHQHLRQYAESTAPLPDRVGSSLPPHPPGNAPERPHRPRSLHPPGPVSYTHLRAHETVLDLVCRLLLEKQKKQ